MENVTVHWYLIGPSQPEEAPLPNPNTTDNTANITLKVFRQHHLAPLKKLPLVAKRGPQWQTVTRIIHHCAISGEKVLDATVTDENRNETSLWNEDCDFPGGLTTEIFYSGEKLSPPGEKYIERARLKRERKKQRYEKNESQRIKTTMRVWFLHEWNIPIRSGNYHKDAKGRWRLNKMFKEMQVNDSFQVQILASSVWDPSTLV